MSKMEKKARLIEIQEEIQELASEALKLIRSESEVSYERAKSYWYAQVIMALSHDHYYLGGAGVALQDSINELDDFESDENE